MELKNKLVDIKLFRMNDYDWVAAESKEQAQEWYLKECGIDEEDNPFDDIIEESLSKKFITPLGDIPEERQKVYDVVEYGNCLYARVPFSDMLEYSCDYYEPFIAGSTEF